MSGRRWTKVEDGIYESSDGWQVVNPWRLDTALRNRWIVRRYTGDGEWQGLDGDYPTMRAARAAIDFDPPAALDPRGGAR
jgi:hypothetical protein